MSLPKPRKLKWVLIVGGLLIAGLLTLFLLIWNGFLHPNALAADAYEVRGVDVSHYQGKINWTVLAEEEIDFAFLKATEGSTYVDETFADNLKGALATELRVGAYHFFSFSSGGRTQAETFIANVPADADLLPPVVDLEFYGKYFSDPLPRETVQIELDALLSALEEHYGRKPILYATEESYEAYLAGGYAEYDIWIRNVLTAPALSDGRKWTFWQYSNRGRLDGCEGEEKYIDLNVFCGSREEFANYGKSGRSKQ